MAVQVVVANQLRELLKVKEFLDKFCARTPEGTVGGIPGVISRESAYGIPGEILEETPGRNYEEIPG